MAFCFVLFLKDFNFSIGEKLITSCVYMQINMVVSFSIYIFLFQCAFNRKLGMLGFKKISKYILKRIQNFLGKLFLSILTIFEQKKNSLIKTFQLIIYLSSVKISKAKLWKVYFQIYLLTIHQPLNPCCPWDQQLMHLPTNLPVRLEWGNREFIIIELDLTIHIVFQLSEEA